MDKKYLLDLGERILFTFLAAFVSVLVADGLGTVNLTLLKAAALAGLAAVATLVKGLVAKYVNNPDSAGFTDVRETKLTAYHSPTTPPPNI